MSQDDSERSRHSDQLNRRVSDGGGCTETWTALSEMRDEYGRRDFITHVGLTLGVFAIGGGSTSAAAQRRGGDRAGGSSQEAQKETLRGRERGQLLRRANRDEDVRQVAQAVGEKPEPTAVYEYTVGDIEGKGVTFGDPEAEGTSIRYHESPSLDGGSTAYGGTPVGDGVRGVETSDGSALSFGTPLVRDVADTVPDDVIESADVTGELERERAILIRDVDSADRFDLYVPVARRDEIVDRIVLSGFVSPEDVTPADISLAPQATDGDVSAQNHVVCGPFGVVCTDLCDVLCATLSGLSGAACLSACTATVAGISISPGCGALCAGVVGGTCWPTCTNLVGH